MKIWTGESADDVVDDVVDVVERVVVGEEGGSVLYLGLKAPPRDQWPKISEFVPLI